MIVHVASFLESIGGSIDKEHYLRPIPGRTGYAAYCRKPEYSKAKKKEMAANAVVQNFRSINEEACAILRDPVQKALWQEKHLKALREASKHQRMPDANGKPPVPARLYDFIKHEISLARKQSWFCQIRIICRSNFVSLLQHTTILVVKKVIFVNFWLNFL